KVRAVSRDSCTEQCADDCIRLWRASTALLPKKGPCDSCNFLTTLPTIDSLASRMMLMLFYATLTPMLTGNLLLWRPRLLVALFLCLEFIPLSAVLAETDLPPLEASTSSHSDRRTDEAAADPADEPDANL